MFCVLSDRHVALAYLPSVNCRVKFHGAEPSARNATDHFVRYCSLFKEQDTYAPFLSPLFISDLSPGILFHLHNFYSTKEYTYVIIQFTQFDVHSKVLQLVQLSLFFLFLVFDLD